MLHDLTGTVAPKDIDGSIVVASWPCLTAVYDNQVTLGNRAFYLHVFARILVSHSFEVGNKSSSAAFDTWIVLNVIVAHIAVHGLTRLTIVEHQIVESDNIRLVPFKIAHLVPFQKQPSRLCLQRVASASDDTKLLLHDGRRVVAMEGNDLSILYVENIAARDVYRLSRRRKDSRGEH
jgi:hypothetical protein